MWRFRRTTLIVVGCFSVLAGLGISRKLYFEPTWWLLVFSPALLIFKNKNLASLMLVVLLGISLGLARGSIYMQKLSELKTLSGQKIVVEAIARTDAVYGKNSQLEFTASNIKQLQPRQQSLAGTFKISGFGVPMVYRGDQVRVSGKVFPMRGSNQARMSYTQIQVIGSGSQWFDKFARTFTTGMENALPEPQASFGLGLLIGQRTNLSQDIITQLTMVGLVHIVAVSGYNLTILVRAAQRLKLQSKYQKTLLSIGLIIAFILVTGFSASIIRAAIVSTLSLWAWYYGREIRPLLLIVFTAVLTGLFNPFYVWGDLGWYLSFLAFFGILIIAPLLVSRLFSRPPRLLNLVIIETLCAEVMTLPLIMMTFGQLSLVALLANTLIVPLVPYAMLLSSLAALAGAVLPQWAGWVAWPAHMLLTYMLDVVHLLADVPSIFLHVSISSTVMICTYFVILVLVAISHKRIRDKKVLLEK